MTIHLPRRNALLWWQLPWVIVGVELLVAIYLFATQVPDGALWPYFASGEAASALRAVALAMATVNLLVLVDVWLLDRGRRRVNGRPRPLLAVAIAAAVILPPLAVGYKAKTAERTASDVAHTWSLDARGQYQELIAPTPPEAQALEVGHRD